MSQIRKAVIPAAGLGTRFLPATKAQPKEMLPIIDKPAIQYIVEEAINSGIEEILIITGRNKRAIEDHFDRAIELELKLEEQQRYELLEIIKKISDINVFYIRQKEAKGLGHAVLCAKQFVGNEPFAVMLGDDIVDNDVPCLQQLIEAYQINPGTILGVQEVPLDKVQQYGIVKPQAISQDTWLVEDVIEKPPVSEAPSRLAISGRYILPPEIFAALENTPPGRGGEIQLTDAIKALIGKVPTSALRFAGRRYDIGDKQGYLEATVEFALKRPDLREQFLQYLAKQVPAILPMLEAAAHRTDTK